MNTHLDPDCVSIWCWPPSSRVHTTRFSRPIYIGQYQIIRIQIGRLKSLKSDAAHGTISSREKELADQRRVVNEAQLYTYW